MCNKNIRKWIMLASFSFLNMMFRHTLPFLTNSRMFIVLVISLVSGLFFKEEGW